MPKDAAGSAAQGDAPSVRGAGRRHDRRVRLPAAAAPCFFLKAEAAIGDVAVTGVQTCALPISEPITSRDFGMRSGTIASKLIWTYFEAMVPDRMPKSLLVIGSGAIGIEFASFYRTLGAEEIGRASCRERG